MATQGGQINMDELNTQYNLSMKKTLEEKFGKPLSEIYNSAAGRQLIGVFTCKCGKFISPSVLRYFNFDVVNAVCWDCQNSEATIASRGASEASSSHRLQVRLDRKNTGLKEI